MFKKSVVALALFAGILTSSSSFAATVIQADYTVIAARLRGLDRAELTVQYVGAQMPQACAVGVRFIVAGGDPLFGVRGVASWAPQSGSIVRNAGGQWSTTAKILVSLPSYAQAQMAAHPNAIFYFQAVADMNNDISEYATTSLTGVPSFTTSLEGNNTLSFSAIPSMSK